MAIPVLLFAIALGVRAGSAALFPEPAYPDAYYYVNVARALASGSGLSVDYVWNFVEVGGRLPLEGRLPLPSNAHWMPLAVLVQVPFIWVLGATPVASALPFWLAAAAVAPMTYVMGREAHLEPWQAAAAGVLVAFPGALGAYLGQPDNFGIYMLLGALALWLCARALRGDDRSFAAGGLIVGLAFLSRNDGLLLGVPYAAIFLLGRLAPSRARRIGWGPAALCLVGFVVVVAPWLVRQLDVFGSISPSAASGRILWIAEYRELYSVSREASLASFLGQGAVDIAWSRLGGLGFALFLFAGMPMLFLLVPFLLAGLWLRRQDAAFTPWSIYAIVLFTFTALVSAVHVPYGTFLHSVVALLPHAYLLVMVGLAATVAAAAARRPAWDARRAARNLSLMVVGVVVVGAVGATVLTLRAWRAERDGRADVLATLRSVAHREDRVMSPDAGAYRYHGGWSGVVTPEDPLPVVREALERYGVRWLALERHHSTAALLPVLEGRERPAWLSAPLVESYPDSPVGPTSAEPRADAARDTGPGAALFAVCLTPDDERCTD